MKRFFYKFLIKLFSNKQMIKLIDVDLLNRKMAQQRILNNITIGKKTVIYEEAKVSNHQLNKTKINIGNYSHIRGRLLVFNYGGNITIGDNCFIGEGTRIWSGDSISIGNNVLISHNVSIVDTDSHEIDHFERSDRFADLIKNGHWKSKGSIKTRPVRIDDFAWISFNSTILKGVKIGKGAIVGAGSVVTKDIPDWVVVAGNPAKVVRVLPKPVR